MAAGAACIGGGVVMPGAEGVPWLGSMALLFVCFIFYSITGALATNTTCANEVRRDGIRGPIRKLESLGDQNILAYTMGGEIPIMNRRSELSWYEESRRFLRRGGDKVDPRQTDKQRRDKVARVNYPRQLVDEGRGRLEYVGLRPVWTDEVIDILLDALRNGEDISPPSYPKAAADITAAMEYAKGLHDMDVFVGGSISPWVEALALHHGARSTTTADYNVPIYYGSKHSVRTMHALSVADETVRSNTRYDVVVSFSSIEHAGMGRYGDAMDPFADLATMKEFHSMLKPGGFLLLGVPMNEMDIISTAGRIYGPKRFPVLVCMFDFIARFSQGEVVAKSDYKRRVIDRETGKLLRPNGIFARKAEDKYIFDWQPVNLLKRAG